MTDTRYTKRTVWIAECEHRRHVVTEKPPRERYCAECQRWIPFIETTYLGPDIFATPEGT